MKETTLENKASFTGNDFKKKFSPPFFLPLVSYTLRAYEGKWKMKNKKYTLF